MVSFLAEIPKKGGRFLLGIIGRVFAPETKYFSRLLSVSEDKRERNKSRAIAN